MKARGVYPRAFAVSSAMSTTAEAPSVSGDELAAVTDPYFRSKTGLSDASFSGVESALRDRVTLDGVAVSRWKG